MNPTHRHGLEAEDVIPNKSIRSKDPERRGSELVDAMHQYKRRDGAWGTMLRAVITAGVVVLFVGGATTITVSQRDGLRPKGSEVGEGNAAYFSGEEVDNGVFGMAASSSMWGVEPSLYEEPALLPRIGHQRSLLFARDERMARLRGTNGKPPIPANNGGRPLGAPKKTGEPAMLYDFSKQPVDYLDLDKVQDGWLWIPVAVDKFDALVEDPLVKMCQVNYRKYSDAPWLLPMGGLLAINSGCAEIDRDIVQLVRLSVLERLLEDSVVPVSKPTGFIFHETRCGSTLVANMLASVQSNVMWSESTGPWKVLHTCPKCEKRQIVRFLKVIIDAMSRSPHHEHFYFKFQSSEDIDAVTTAFPDVPWIFIFREPVEVMMSRLGAQRIGMEGMEKEVTARVEKGMTQGQGVRSKAKGKGSREQTTAQQLSGLCKKAITAYEASPEHGMMVEYLHIPDGIVDTVIPGHFKVKVTKEDYERMMTSTQKYSKVATFQKEETPDSKFIDDGVAKHHAASVAVTENAQRFLYPDYYKLKSLETWDKY